VVYPCSSLVEPLFIPCLSLVSALAALHFAPSGPRRLPAASARALEAERAADLLLVAQPTPFVETRLACGAGAGWNSILAAQIQGRLRLCSLAPWR